MHSKGQGTMVAAEAIWAMGLLSCFFKPHEAPSVFIKALCDYEEWDRIGPS